MDAQSRRTQIAEAVLDIIIHQGVASVTVRRVAAAVGISVAALYRHYTNKADMLKSAINEYQELMTYNIKKATLDSGSPFEALRRLYFMTMTLTKHGYALPSLLSSDIILFNELPFRTRTTDSNAMLRSYFVRIVQQAQRHGEIRSDIRAEEIAIFFIGLLVPPALIKARMEDALDLPRQLATNWALFAQAVAVG